MRRSAPLVTGPLLALALAACGGDEPLASDADFAADLTVGAEVPPAGHPTDASGRAEFFFDEDDDEMSFTIEVSSMTEVLTAHIHGPATATEGGAGILVTLFIGPGGGTGDVDGTLVSGAFTEPDAQAHLSMDSLLVLMNNGHAYVNVHTALNPAGEIRGQIASQ